MMLGTAHQVMAWWQLELTLTLNPNLRSGHSAQSTTNAERILRGYPHDVYIPVIT